VERSAHVADKAKSANQRKHINLIADAHPADTRRLLSSKNVAPKAATPTRVVTTARRGLSSFDQAISDYWDLEASSDTYYDATETDFP